MARLSVRLLSLELHQERALIAARKYPMLPPDTFSMCTLNSLSSRSVTTSCSIWIAISGSGDFVYGIKRLISLLISEHVLTRSEVKVLKSVEAYDGSVLRRPNSRDRGMRSLARLCSVNSVLISAALPDFKPCGGPLLCTSR